MATRFTMRNAPGCSMRLVQNAPVAINLEVAAAHEAQADAKSSTENSVGWSSEQE